MSAVGKYRLTDLNSIIGNLKFKISNIRNVTSFNIFIKEKILS